MGRNSDRRLVYILFLMTRHTPSTTRTYILYTYTTLFRSPQPLRRDRAVRLIGYSDLEIADSGTVRQLCARDRRRIAAPPLERIGEPLFERRQRIGARQPAHRPADRVIHLPQIVDPVAMIGVIVRPDHRVERRHIGREQLFAQVGAGIDEHARTLMLDEQRGAGAAVARFGDRKSTRLNSSH